MLQGSPGHLVGRSAELGRVTGLLEQAAAGEPVVAVVSGDAGVGKTSLITEVGARAASRGFMVLSGRCAELGDSVPYLPLADALRSAVTGPGPLADALAARPVLGQLLPDRGAAEPAAGDLAGMVQQQLFGAVLGMLAELAAAAPVLLMLEDLHWADRSTRDLLTFLSRVLHRERVAVIATYRSDDLYRSHPLRRVVAELARLPSVTMIELGPLTAEAMAEHLRALSAGPLTASELEGIIRRAEGNPYYAEELLAAAGDGSGLPEGPGIPSGLAELLLARLQRLSPAGQQVLNAAAVAGPRIQDDLLRAACGLPVAEYEQAVREAVAHQLLIPDGDQGYAFRHALLREAAYADLLPGERTRLHARLAELMADETRLATVPGAAAELAHHSLASHDIPGAFTASIRAGQEAKRLAAPAEAHRHYDQALALWERVSEPEKRAGMSRGRLAFDSASSAGSSGDLAPAVHQLRRLAGYLEDHPGEDPKLRCRVSERLAYYLLEVGKKAQAVAAARTAIAALPDDPPSWQHARALATYAQTLVYADEPAQARTWALRAREAARAADAPWVEADALVTLGQLDERAGRIPDAISLYTLADRQAREAGVLGVQLRAAFMLANIHLERGDLAEASATAHEGVQRADEAGLGLAPYGLDLQYLHYLAHVADGNWDHAQELADGFAVRVTTEREALLSAMALFLDVARGSPVAAERLTWLQPFWPGEPFSEYIARGVLAERSLWRGDAGSAAAEAEAAVRVQLDHLGGYGPRLIRPAAVGVAAQADLAARARAAGDQAAAAAAVAAARDLVETAREGAAYRTRPDWVLGVEGRAWLARAEAEWLRAQGDNQPAAWQAVVDAFAPAFVYETARSRWRLAEALLTAGRRDEAEREWQLALGAAERLGAAPLRSALADLGRRGRLSREGGPEGPAGGSAQPDGAGGRPGRPALSVLTARERDVLRLLAEGRSNREIAAELFIAPKTASVHVSNILGKLGAASRTEAAAIAHAEGVPEKA